MRQPSLGHDIITMDAEKCKVYLQHSRIKGAQGSGIELGVDPVGLEVVEEEVLWQVSKGDKVAHEMD